MPLNRWQSHVTEVPGRSNRSKHRGRLPGLQGIEHRAWQPVLRAPLTAPESVIKRT
jgi:hypothetical protein